MICRCLGGSLTSTATNGKNYLMVIFLMDKSLEPFGTVLFGSVIYKILNLIEWNQREPSQMVPNSYLLKRLL